MAERQDDLLSEDVAVLRQIDARLRGAAGGAVNTLRLGAGDWTTVEHYVERLVAAREARAAYFAMWHFFLRLPSPTPLSDAVQREAMRLRDQINSPGPRVDQ